MVGTDALEVCQECGYPLIIDPDMGIREISGLCGDCDLAMGQACPDCRAEPYEPCHIDCSSRWT